MMLFIAVLSFRIDFVERMIGQDKSNRISENNVKTDMM